MMSDHHTFSFNTIFFFLNISSQFTSGQLPNRCPSLNF